MYLLLSRQLACTCYTERRKTERKVKKVLQQYEGRGQEESVGLFYYITLHVQRSFSILGENVKNLKLIKKSCGREVWPLVYDDIEITGILVFIDALKGLGHEIVCGFMAVYGCMWYITHYVHLVWSQEPGQHCTYSGGF
jgi:hypothetical protein